MKASILTIAASILPVTVLFAQEPVVVPAAPPKSPPVEERFDPLVPYTGESRKGVDTKTLTGKIMAGYQGWFNTPDDGAGLGWTHWARSGSKPFGPGNVTVDLWPDMSEYSASERYVTAFKHPNGQPAVVFSSHNRLTVLRHFKWMREYGIDGAFVQRFANGLKGKLRYHKDVVLSHAREGANLEGRAYAVMYDLSGINKGATKEVIADWRMLREKMKMGSDPAYLHHEGKPLVAVWGLGFSGEDRKYTLAECRELVEFLKADGCAVMLGVPTGWRDQYRDATKEEDFHDLLKLADIISPWSVGRYLTPGQANVHAAKYYEKDMEWCRGHSMDYLPVVFPGFSWHNLNPEDPPDKIPRLKGEFLWTQFVGAKKAGASMIYVAMFDEVDEGTAIFKCTNEPPVGESPFINYEGLPSDYYLWLTGEAGRMLRGERPVQEMLPARR